VKCLIQIAIILTILTLCACDDTPALPKTETEQSFTMDNMKSTVHILPTGERVLFVTYSDSGGTHLTCCYLPPITKNVEK